MLLTTSPASAHQYPDTLRNGMSTRNDILEPPLATLVTAAELPWLLLLLPGCGGCAGGSWQQLAFPSSFRLMLPARMMGLREMASAMARRRSICRGRVICNSVPALMLHGRPSSATLLPNRHHQDWSTLAPASVTHIPWPNPYQRPKHRHCVVRHLVLRDRRFAGHPGGAGPREPLDLEQRRKGVRRLQALDAPAAAGVRRSLATVSIIGRAVGMRVSSELEGLCGRELVQNRQCR